MMNTWLFIWPHVVRKGDDHRRRFILHIRDSNPIMARMSLLAFCYATEKEFGYARGFLLHVLLESYEVTSSKDLFDIA